MYDSTGGVTNHPLCDTEPAVFFLDASGGWPTNTMRKRVDLIQRVDSVITNEITVEYWNSNVSSTEYPTELVIWGHTAVFDGIVNDLPSYEYEDPSETFHSYEWRESNGGAWHIDDAVGSFTFLSVVEPPAEGIIQASDGDRVYTYTTNWIYGGPVQVVSSNKAAAIEVYPARLPKYASWMKQGNRDVKWMVSLSNGVDFYRDENGDVVWFNCPEEWVSNIPTDGIY